LSLELSVLKVELVDTFLEFCNVGSLLCGEVVQGVDDGGSEFVEGCDDLSHDVLVGEVLVGGQVDE
jgi:hypothetical protein